MVRIRSIAAESLGEALGLVPGTELFAINGRALEDFLDWEFLSADEQFVLRGRLPDGTDIEYDIERPEGMPMGVELDPPHIRRCANRCDFCFVDGLPEGLRPNLYIRDDDYRLSFRYGNFATLTNLKRKDVERILAYRLSPLYVSVHATDPVIRRRVLRNPRAPAIIPQLEMFAAGGIRFHTQIVLQPGVNDGAVLVQSLTDLYGLGGGVLSVSVVPVGLTEFSRLERVREADAAECRAALDVVDRYAAHALAERRVPWVYGSDELYLRAGAALPPAAWYGDFEQMENGVGSVRYLQQRIAGYGGPLPRLDGQRIAVLTGAAMGPLMPQVVADLAASTGGRFEVVTLANELFGPSVTTAALLPGRAFRDALRARRDIDLALLPAEAVNDDGWFIDDLAAAELVRDLPCDTRFSYDFGDVLREGVPV